MTPRGPLAISAVLVWIGCLFLGTVLARSRDVDTTFKADLDKDASCTQTQPDGKWSAVSSLLLRSAQVPWSGRKAALLNSNFGKSMARPDREPDVAAPDARSSASLTRTLRWRSNPFISQAPGDERIAIRCKY